MTSRRSVSRALTGVQDAVCGSDQRLTALFALFTRLYRDEEMPAWERVRSSRRRLLAALLLPVLAVAGVVAAGAAAGCRAGRRAAARTGRGVHRVVLRVRLATAHAGDERPRRLTPGPGSQ